MDKELYILLDNYFNTITATGYLPYSKIKKLVVVMFLEELFKEPDYVFNSDCISQCKYKELYKCLIENNCLYD